MGRIGTLPRRLSSLWRRVSTASVHRSRSRERADHFEAIFEDAPIGVTLVSADGRILQVNPALSRMMGYTAEELRGRSFTSVVRNPDALQVLVQSCLSGERDGFEFERQISRPDGHRFWVQVNAVLVRAGDGTPTHFVAQVLDVDDRHAAAAQVAASEARFAALVEHGSDVIVVMDDYGRLQYASPALRTVLGLDPEERIGSLLQHDVHPDDLDMLVNGVGPTLKEGPGATARVEFRFRHADGTWRWLEATVSNQLANPAVAGHVINARDVTDRVLALERAAHQAAHDVLTGLPNRALLEDRMSQAMSAARRRGEQLAVLYLDLDHFKVVNDTFGHSAGDRLLTEAAARLQKVARSSDTVTRLGGDEFVVTGPVVDEAAAAALATRVCAAFSPPFDIDGQDVQVTASVGLAIANEDGGHVGLLATADRALYKAKSLGRNRWVADAQEDSL